MSQPLIQFENVTKSFGDQVVLDGVSLEMHEGNITSVIGKSGTGKSVMLKHIVGLLEPDSGRILFNGKDIGAMNRQERTELKNHVSYMFQNNALFDSLTVFENVALPLKEKTRLKKSSISDRVMEKIELMELTEVTHKYPSQISGGMQKRVALARALVKNPKIVLFDEPTTGQDPIRKSAILSMIAHYKDKFDFTAVVVSHDVPDIFFISNRILILDKGHIPFQGTPMEFEQADHPVVRQFLGSLEHLKDDLTGLENFSNLERRYVERMLSMNENSRLSGLVITIHDLRQIMENVGHIAAQRIIQSIAEVVRNVLGKDCYCARHAPDTIFCLLPDKDRKQTRNLLETIKQDLGSIAFLNPGVYPGNCQPFKILAGVAQAQVGTDLRKLMQAAKDDEAEIADLECQKQGTAV
jgi:phospholipid/cholesterol/gamma-HCH transport system ATP-binding protein